MMRGKIGRYKWISSNRLLMVLIIRLISNRMFNRN